MAATAEGRQLTRTHRNAQLTLRAALIRDLLLIWNAVFDPTEPDSYGEFVQIAEILIRQLYGDSSALARVYYREFLEAEGVPTRVSPIPAPELAHDRIRRSLFATGLAGSLRALRLGYPPQAAKAQGFVLASGSASRLALLGGRETITETTRVDGLVTGWQRITSGSPCAFCAMLASRGPVYRESTVGFSAHDHCSCTPEPYHHGSEWPTANQQFRDLWNETTRGHGGRDAVNAFRAAIEGRTE